MEQDPAKDLATENVPAAAAVPESLSYTSAAPGKDAEVMKDQLICTNDINELRKMYEA